MSKPAVRQLPRKPFRATGWKRMERLTHSVQPVFIEGMAGPAPRWTVVRVIAGAYGFYALTAWVNPDWRTWPTKEAATQWMTVDPQALDEYPFWGE